MSEAARDNVKGRSGYFADLRLQSAIQTLESDLVFLSNMPSMLLFNANGADRSITLASPAVTPDKLLLAYNVGASGNLVFKTPNGGGTVISVPPTESCFLFCSKDDWYALGGGMSQVGGYTPHIAAGFVKPAAVTQYSIGDIIANSLTAGSVVPITFASAARASGGSGRVVGAQCTLSKASGTIALPSFDLLLFRPQTNIPFALGGYPADNAALAVSAAQMKELVCFMRFDTALWRNPTGAATESGIAAVQTAKPYGKSYAPFNLSGLGSGDLLGILQVQTAWDPTNIAYNFDFLLDVDQD